MKKIYDVTYGESSICKLDGYLDVSIESHLMSFAAEESRLHNGSTYPIEK